MDRRHFFLTSLAGALAAPIAVDAQQTPRPPRVGIVMPTPPPPARHPWLDGLREGLRQLGYVEGQTIRLEVRWPAGVTTPGSEDLLLNLLALPVDVIVVPTSGLAIRAKRATTTIPIVAAAAGALVEVGVVASLARPGGNATGLTTQGAEISAKRVELLKEVLPTLSRVAAIASPYDIVAGEFGGVFENVFERQIETATRAVGFQLEVLRVKTPADLDAAFQTATQSRVGAVMTVTNPFFVLNAARVAELALKHRLPVAAYYREEVEAGALMSYGVDRADMWRRAATYVDRILKGAKPSDLPIEQPRKFELVINLKTAKALGLSIPPSLLLRADQVIE